MRLVQVVTESLAKAQSSQRSKESRQSKSVQHATRPSGDGVSREEVKRRKSHSVKLVDDAHDTVLDQLDVEVDQKAQLQST